MAISDTSTIKISQLEEVTQLQNESVMIANVGNQTKKITFQHLYNQIEEGITPSIEDVAEDLNQEEQTRASADTTLDNKITTEITNRTNADTNILNTLNSAVDDITNESITPGEAPNFNTPVPYNFTSLKVSVEPNQSGSGDPSPSNIRPITPRTSASVTVANAQTSPTESHTYTLQFVDGSTPLNVYGGELDIATGVLVVNRGFITYDGSNDEDWAITNNCHTIYVANIKQSAGASSTDMITIANEYKAAGVKYRDDVPQGGIAKTVGSNNQIAVKDTNYATNEAWRAFLAENPLQMAYKTATTTTYQLTPQQISTLLNNNVLTADCGPIISGSFMPVKGVTFDNVSIVNASGVAVLQSLQIINKLKNNIKTGSSAANVTVNANSYADDVITFDSEFAAAPEVVVAPVGTADNANSGYVSIFITGVTRTACNIRIYNASEAQLSIGYKWLAINL